MVLSGLRLSWAALAQWGRQRAIPLLLSLVVAIGALTVLTTPPALATLEDDRFDGNIFALYAGNGSIVPPKVTLESSLKRDKATLLVFYVDDSRDCKEYSTVVSRLQAFYGRVTDILPIRVDAIPPKPSYEPTEPGYYYKGLVPQTVVFDPQGKLVLDVTGNVPFERVDDTFREVFELLPRSESVELRRRPVNEFNTELVPQ